MKASIFSLLCMLVIFTSCRKEPLIAPASPQMSGTGIQAQAAPVYKGEKVTYHGEHPGCDGAVLFRKLDRSFLRAISYPQEVLQLQKGDTLYIQYEFAKLQNNSGIEFGTKPIEVTAVGIPGKSVPVGGYQKHK